MLARRTHARTGRHEGHHQREGRARRRGERGPQEGQALGEGLHRARGASGCHRVSPGRPVTRARWLGAKGNRAPLGGASRRQQAACGRFARPRRIFVRPSVSAARCCACREPSCRCGGVAGAGVWCSVACVAESRSARPSVEKAVSRQASSQHAVRMAQPDRTFGEGAATSQTRCAPPGSTLGWPEIDCTLKYRSTACGGCGLRNVLRAASSCSANKLTRNEVGKPGCSAGFLGASQINPGCLVKLAFWSRSRCLVIVPGPVPLRFSVRILCERTATSAVGHAMVGLDGVFEAAIPRASAARADLPITAPRPRIRKDANESLGACGPFRRPRVVRTAFARPTGSVGEDVSASPSGPDRVVERTTPTFREAILIVSACRLASD